MMPILPGRVRIRKSIFLRQADRGKMIELPVSSVVWCHASGSVLFDGGCHPSVADNTEARWGDAQQWASLAQGARAHD